MDKIRILLVEDEETLVMIVKETLDAQGFEVMTAPDGIEGLALASSAKPDVIVADVMMPKMDGFDMVRRLRKTDKQTPVLFLTARSSVEDVVEGFELGANDYLKKPFSIQELIVRVKALARHARQARGQAPEKEQRQIMVGQYTFNPVTQMLAFKGQKIELSHRASEILRMLAEKSNQVVTTDDILLALWGDNSFYNARSLQVFITKLRQTLSNDADIKIVNVRGIGYKLVISVGQ